MKPKIFRNAVVLGSQSAPTGVSASPARIPLELILGDVALTENPSTVDEANGVFEDKQGCLE
jgi:hypothetical protein